MDIAHVSKEALFKLCQRCPSCKRKGMATTYLPGFGQTASELPFVSRPKHEPNFVGHRTNMLRGKKINSSSNGQFDKMERIQKDERKRKPTSKSRRYAKGTRT